MDDEARAEETTDGEEGETETTVTEETAEDEE
jgi:hypothetical protein